MPKRVGKYTTSSVFIHIPFVIIASWQNILFEVFEANIFDWTNSVTNPSVILREKLEKPGKAANLLWNPDYVFPVRFITLIK